MPPRRFLYPVRCVFLRSVIALMRNGFISVVGAWLAAAAFSCGNVFDQRHNQTHTEFLVATLLWGDMFVSFGLLIARSAPLFRLQFVTRPGQPFGALRYMKSMFLQTWWVQLLTATAVVAMGETVSRCLPNNLRPLRVELYLSVVPYTAFVDASARYLYRYKTVQGRAEAARRRSQTASCHSTPTLSARSMISWSSMSTVHAETKQNRSKGRRVVDVFTRNLPLIVGTIAPTIYIHAISQSLSSTSISVAWLTALSLVVKITMQEIAKYYTLRRKKGHLRSMAVVVVVPTVLVDTQLRLILLHDQSAAVTISGLLGLAVVEVALRVIKLLVIKRQLQRKQRCLTVLLGQYTNDQPAQDALRLDFEAWQGRLLQYHIAEVSADMYAEYLV